MDNLFLSLGPELSYLINAKIRFVNSTKTTTIPNSDLKRFEVSGIIGLNFRIKQKVDIGIGFSRGFTYTQKLYWTDSLGKDLGASKQFNQYIQFVVRRIF